jgi:hypothetical protein
MSKKISMSEKKFRKARSEAWLDGHEHGVKAGYRDGEKHGRDAMSAALAGEVIAPVLDAAIGLIESNLEDYARVLLVALRDKAREIGGEELDDMADIGDDEYECAGCCEDCQPSERDGDAFAASFDALESLVAQLMRSTADHIEPVQDGRDPL